MDVRNDPAADHARRGRRLLGAALALPVAAGLLLGWGAASRFAREAAGASPFRAVGDALARAAPDAVGGELPPPPVVLGVNVSEVRYWSSAAPFANLAIGADWRDSRWARLSAEHQDANGDITSLPADGVATRYLLVPPTGPKGFEVRCTFTGSGSLSVWGLAGPIESGRNSLRFRAVNERGKQAFPWLILKDVDPKRPPRDLDCRDARLPRSVRFRPEALALLRGFGVIRFMEWQNANENGAVPWRERHTPASINLDRDGASIEDMLALTRELGADPWFVMPWNADDDYVARFARMVRDRLPAGRSVYVEVGNEVWNEGFPVGKQAAEEGLRLGLSADPVEARMRRYAQRTAAVMRIWEAAFAGRSGLVRVLSTQHVWPRTAEIALSFGDTARHVDALATAPYFGATLPGTGNTREGALARLEAELATALRNVADNRRIAAAFRKRYLAYEGGQGLALPVQVPLAAQLQHDPAMYDLYRRYLEAWRRDAGDVLCLFNSAGRPTSWGSWGLVEWEDETPAEAPKLRAVRDFMAASRR